MALKVRCPTCDKGVRVAEADAGQVALCPACGAKVEIPLPPLLAAVDLADADAVGKSDGTNGEKAADASADDTRMGIVALTAPRAEQWPGGGRGGLNGPGGGNGNGNGNGHGNGHALPKPGAALLGSYAVPSALPPHLQGRLSPAPMADNRHGRHPIWWLAAGALATAAVCLVLALGTGKLKLFDTWEDHSRARLVELKREAEALAAAGRMPQAHDKYLQMDALIDGRPVRDAELKQAVDAAHQDRRRVYEVLLEERMAAAQARARAAAEAQARALHQVQTALESPPPPAVPSHSAQPSTGPATAPAAAPAATQPAALAALAGPATAPARRQRPPLQPVAVTEDVLTDEEIGQSIQRGVDWLLTQFDPKKHVIAGGGRGATHTGGDALAVYALLQSSQALEDPRISIRDERMKAKIEALKKLPISGHHETYARGLRATCLALFNRREDFATLKADAEYLRNSHDHGAYSYQPLPRVLSERAQVSPRTAGKPAGPWDNSNSQYGLLGVWSAVEAEPRIEVNTDYWRAVEAHWTRTQYPDGQWGYREPEGGGRFGGGGGRLTMTCAGIASLFVAHEYLEAPLSATPSTRPADVMAVGREPFSPALKRGLDWFERGNNAVDVRGGTWWGYALYGVERVGLASGFKYFGKHDWYRVLAEQIVSNQQDNGSWGDGVIDTSFALLFLSRGRHPILMNKLRFDRRGDVAAAADAGAAPGSGFWANRPRDAANLARFTGRVLERPLNWQVVSLENEFQDWLDCPILYIASHATPRLTQPDYDKLRLFIDAGGMIFTHADASSPAFNHWAEQLPSKLSLRYEMSDVPADHLIHNILFKTSPRPHLKGVSNGSRLLVLHSPADLSHHWQKREDRQFEFATIKRPAEEKARVLAPFHFGANLFVYAAGKRDLRNRLDSPYVPPVRSDPVDVITVARLEYAGNWDPEPGAWRRYSNWFHRQTGTRLEPRAVKLATLRPDPSLYPFAHLTGTAPHKFTKEEVAALRAYVEAGGVVIADVCGGGPAFGQSLHVLASQSFPNAAAAPVPADHPMLSAGAPGMEDVTRPRVRLYNIEYRGVPGTDFSALAAGKGHFLYTTNDLASGLLGTNTWGILGYEPKYAQALMKNLIFWTADGQPKPGKP